MEALTHSRCLLTLLAQIQTAAKVKIKSISNEITAMGADILSSRSDVAIISV